MLGSFVRALPLMFLLAAGLCRATPSDDLVKAAELNDGRTVLTLLLRGTDPNVPDARGRSALGIALSEESDKALTSLLADPRLDVNSANASGETPLMLAAVKGQLEAVKQLVKKGALVNRAGWTPLHYACSGPDNGVAAWLLKQGADINARSANGTTPLMMAARYGAMDLAEVLLKAGADSSLVNAQNLSAADFARAAGRDALLKVLDGRTR